MSYRIMSCHAVLHRIAQDRAAPRRIAPHRAAPRRIASRDSLSTAPRRIASRHVEVQGTLQQGGELAAKAKRSSQFGLP